MVIAELLSILPLASAAAWWAVAAVPLVRRRLSSRFESAVAAFAVLIGAWAFLDWIFLGFKGGQQATAIAVSNVRISVITVATFVLVLAMKWIAVGRSKFDVLLVVPVLGSLAIIWAGIVWEGAGLTTGVVPEAWGPRLVRDPSRYTLWASQQIAYVAATIVLVAHLYLERREMPGRIRRRFFWTTGSLTVMLGIWISTNIYNNVTQTGGVPWFSSLLFVPAAIILAAIAPMSTDQFGEMLRAVSAIQERVVAVYLFYRSGEPLVALASGRSLPIEAEQLEGVLAIVGNFVETSVSSSRGLQVTAMRYDGLGIVAVRGDFVIAAAVYDGPAYDTLRAELIRAVRQFEERRWQDLGTWEEATKVTEGVAGDLSSLLYRPEPMEGAGRPRSAA